MPRDDPMTNPKLTLDSKLDPHAWLEDIDGERSLEWVRQRNAEALAELENDARFLPLRDRLRRVETGEGLHEGGRSYHLGRDAFERMKHVAGAVELEVATYRQWLADFDAAQAAEEEKQRAKVAEREQRRNLHTAHS